MFVDMDDKFVIIWDLLAIGGSLIYLILKLPDLIFEGMKKFRKWEREEEAKDSK